MFVVVCLFRLCFCVWIRLSVSVWGVCCLCVCVWAVAVGLVVCVCCFCVVSLSVLFQLCEEIVCV